MAGGDKGKGGTFAFAFNDQPIGLSEKPSSLSSQLRLLTPKTCEHEAHTYSCDKFIALR